jgi:hypothetical protein
MIVDAELKLDLFPMVKENNVVKMPDQPSISLL